MLWVMLHDWTGTSGLGLGDHEDGLKLPLQVKYIAQLLLKIAVIIFSCIFSVFRVCCVVS